jgi:GalNAc-alpha-(1->4)-GalNAc-alpha-(1->3)-diNAcBac-PP-undecaprenol alpha-1,4-N-acetyl-D-galactosaminyltransferase
MRIKSICLVIHSLSLGGMERVMSILANNFCERENVVVSIVLIGKEPKISFTLNNKISVFRPSFKFDDSNRFKSKIKRIKYLRATVKKISPDVVLSFGEYWNNLVLLSLFKLKYPVYIADRSQPNKNLGKLQNYLRHNLYPNAAGYIAQTEKAREVACINKWSNNTIVIGNPIKSISHLKQSDKENIVLTVGRLIPTKHIDQLIDIFRNVTNTSWKLVIIGGNAKKNTLLEEYRELVKQLGLNDQIELIGATKNVVDYYRKAKIFAFTSSSEGFPNAIGEAMSFGLPVIAYDCIAGPSDLIEDGETGFLIEDRDQKVFEQKLSWLMQKADLRNRFAAKSLEKIKVFNSDLIADKFFNFINNIK